MASQDVQMMPHDLTLFDIFTLCEDTKRLIAHLREWGLILREGEYNCEKCGGMLTLYSGSSRIEEACWKCSNFISVRKQKRRRCMHTKGFRHGTFFANSHLQIDKF